METDLNIEEDVEEMGDAETEGKITSITKAVKAKCLDCCAGDRTEVKLCPAVNCPLHNFRFGKNPFRKKREYTEEQRKAMGERLRAIRREGE